MIRFPFVAAGFVFKAVRGTVVAKDRARTACSSLPDVRFDEPDGAAGDGGIVVASCTCQVPPAGWTPVNFAATSRPSLP